MPVNTGCPSCSSYSLAQSTHKPHKRTSPTNSTSWGAVAFLNGESFSGLGSHRLQSVQPGYGAGIRVKLNKTSRTNVDIDYGLGNQGSRGLFVNIGELF